MGISWTTKYGQTARLIDMSDSSLANTIDYLRQKSDEEYAGYWQARPIQHDEQDHPFFDPNSRLGMIKTMENELFKRKHARAH